MVLWTRARLTPQRTGGHDDESDGIARQCPPSIGAALVWPQPDAAAAISAFVDQGPFGVAVVDTDMRFLLVSRGLAAPPRPGRGADRGASGRRGAPRSPRPTGSPTGLRQVLDSGVPVVDAETRGTFDDPGAARSFTSSFYRLDAASGEALGVVVLITETTELRSAAEAAASAGAQLDLLQRITGALSGGVDHGRRHRRDAEGCGPGRGRLCRCARRARRPRATWWCRWHRWA